MGFRPTTNQGEKMNLQQEIEELNREIHNLGVKIDNLQIGIEARIREVRKLEEMRRVAVRAGIGD